MTMTPPTDRDAWKTPEEMASAHVSKKWGKDPAAYQAMMWHCREDYMEGFTAGDKRGYERGVREAAKHCCTIDSSDSSHETAESNANAILSLLPSEKEKDT